MGKRKVSLFLYGSFFHSTRSELNGLQINLGTSPSELILGSLLSHIWFYVSFLLTANEQVLYKQSSGSCGYHLVTTCNGLQTTVVWKREEITRSPQAFANQRLLEERRDHEKSPSICQSTIIGREKRSREVPKL